jgi:carbamoyl-phosphate synthase large subunit
MTKALTIFRTAAGSPPSVSQYRYFQQLGHRVIAGDCAPLSVGFVFADAAYVLPRADAPQYVDALLDVCQRERVDVFLPALDEELLLVAEQRERFDAISTKVIVSSLDTLRVCVDKLQTYNAFREHGIPTIPTVPASDATGFATFPAIVKPRRGRGSSGVHVARTPAELAFFAQYVRDAVIQPFIVGTEFTVDVLADQASELKIVSPRKRLATDSGISSKGITAWHDEMVSYVRRIVDRLRIVGPANIQCFVTTEGQLLFSEINARLAGTCILSVAAGVPLLEGVCAMAVSSEIPVCLEPVDPKILMRYWAEAYVAPDQVIAKTV